jgi:hypothetical protein
MSPLAAESVFAVVCGILVLIALGFARTPPPTDQSD